MCTIFNIFLYKIWDTMNTGAELTVIEIRSMQHTWQCAVSHMFNISGQNINFVCGLVDKSLDVQINARRIKFVKYKHKYRNQHAVLHKLYMHVVIGGDLVQGLGRRSRRLNAEKKLPSPPKCEISGDGGDSLSW